MIEAGQAGELGPLWVLREVFLCLDRSPNSFSTCTYGRFSELWHDG